MKSAGSGATFVAAFIALAFAQDTPRRLVRTAGDLPALSYQSAAAPADLIRSQEIFSQLGRKLREDIEVLLRDYTIEDRTTLRGLHSTLLELDMMENRADDARKEIAVVRKLQDKPAAKMISGILEEALLTSGGVKANPQEFFRYYSAAINSLPWDVVGDRMKQARASLQILSESVLVGLAETQFGPPLRKTGRVDLAGAQTLADMRFTFLAVAPVKDSAAEALGSFIAAHNAPKPDIWAARSVTLDPGAKAKPVVIGIWDTGVDRSLFKGQIAAAGAVPGFDFYGNRTDGELTAFDATQKQRWPDTKRYLQGALDLQAAIDTPEASGFRKYMSTLKPEAVQPFRQSMNFASEYIHGTHVAGIALAGNPFGRIVLVRYGFPYQVPPPAPTLAGTKKFAAGASELTAYMHTQRARVVNMSWADNLREYEEMLQANGVGADPAERRQMAHDMLARQRDGLRAALSRTPEILYVAAAGNSNSNTTFDEDIWASLHDLPNLLIAGAVDQAGQEASFTCFGPAVSVYSNGFQVESLIPGGERLKLSGTSMAAPNVTNLAAKLIALDPSLTPPEVVKLIRDGSDLSADGRFRLINPKRSVELLKPRTQ
jgi:subtilisin family serine protease